MTSRIDMHLHTDASDGSVSVEVLVARAALAGLSTIAITEHDNIDSWERGAKAGRQNGVKLIPGIEISTTCGEQDIHLLGYDFSPSAKPMLDMIEHQRLLRLKRFQSMLRKLKEVGIRISPAMIHTEKTSAPGRVHVAQAMVEAGVVPNVESAFRRYLRRGRPAFVPYETIQIEDAIKVVHESGGFTSLAHPIFSEGGMHMLNKLAAAKLDAIEVLHPRHSVKLQETLIRFCESHDLMMTGGSDWHGTLGETYDLGEWFLEKNGKSKPASLSKLLCGARPVRPVKLKRTLRMGRARAAAKEVR